ncbi:MAG: hypothetical protein ACJAY5_000148 [Actinomycetes bacterium]|jgi:hypothetical protein
MSAGNGVDYSNEYLRRSKGASRIVDDDDIDPWSQGIDCQPDRILALFATSDNGRYETYELTTHCLCLSHVGSGSSHNDLADIRHVSDLAKCVGQE